MAAAAAAAAAQASPAAVSARFVTPWRLPTGNLLTDAAVAELQQLLQCAPGAGGVRRLDLSHNRHLTWRCCETLGAMLAGTQEPLHGGGGSGSSSSDTPQKQLRSSMRDSTDDGGLQQQAHHTPQPLRRALQQQALLTHLRLEGDALGDKGARALAAALQGNAHMQVCGRRLDACSHQLQLHAPAGNTISPLCCLQVLCLAQCGLHDAGGAAVCVALQQHPQLTEFNLGWNALGHQTARAVAAMLR